MPKLFDLDVCARCGRKMPTMDLLEHIEMMEAYRNKFPKTWRNETPSRICNDCFAELQEYWANHNSEETDDV